MPEHSRAAYREMGRRSGLTHRYLAALARLELISELTAARRAQLIAVIAKVPIVEYDGLVDDSEKRQPR